MCDEGETADRADAVRTESQKMESRAGETALDGSARSIIVLIVVGMLVGVLSGTFGIGGGTVIVPALVWLGLSQRNAAATSMLAIVPTSISGVISYATGGHVDWLAAALLFCGMFIGGQIGSWLLSRLPELVLRWIFVAFLVFVVINQVSFVPSRDHQIVMTVVTGIGLALLGVVIGTLAGLLGLESIVGEGFLRVGDLSAPMTAEAFADFAARQLGDTVRVMGHRDALIRRVGLCSGGGCDEWADAHAMGADAFLTGEVKHHIALDASYHGVVLLEAGHFATENPGIFALMKALQNAPDIVQWKMHISRSERSAYE